MNPDVIKECVQTVPKVLIPLVLCYGLSQARRVTNDVANNVDKVGVDGWKKSRIVHKALFNFYAILVLLFIVCIKSLGIIEDQLFIGIVIAIITGLGIKLTNDIREKEDKQESNK